MYHLSVRISNQLSRSVLGTDCIFLRMAIVNKPTGPRLPLSNISLNAPNNPSSTPSQSAIDALKRKFQRVNQEIVKQNVLLQENLARTRQDHHAVLQENVRLKGKIVAIESKLHEAEGVCIDTKVTENI